ncbi:2798_t:CDS:2, partial [Acaulospora colombiana]
MKAPTRGYLLQDNGFSDAEYGPKESDNRGMLARCGIDAKAHRDGSEGWQEAVPSADQSKLTPRGGTQTNFSLRSRIHDPILFFKKKYLTLSAAAANYGQNEQTTMTIELKATQSKVHAVTAFQADRAELTRLFA